MFKSGTGSRTRWAAILIAAVMFLSACTSSPSTSTDGVGDTLTFAVSGAPTLDPYKANVDPNSAPNINLAYSGLIRLNADGTYSGDLAETYGYTDNENKKFQLKLRAGVKFADGTPVDAAAVVASLNYFLKEGSNAASFGGSIDTVTAPDSSTVLITNKTSNPVMPMLLSQVLLAGSIISPAGLADTSRLAQQTFGAGPYVLDPANTVPNDHYTYTANPNYWNKDLQHWKKVVVKVIADANATVQAIQANQVDSAMVLGQSGAAVEAAGLRHKEDSAVLIGMILADRDGAAAPELKDVRVRQALNYAIDRSAVTKAIFGQFAEPTAEMALPNFDGFDKAADTRYPYDEAKAKSLLAEAGYPNGFTLKVETQGFFGIDIVTQAVLAQWKKVGVNVTDLTTDAQPPQWIENVLTKKFPATGFAYGGLPTYLSSQNFIRPVANPFNPFASKDDQLEQLLDKAAAEPDTAKRPGLYSQVNARLADLAWFAPVSRIQAVLIVGPRLADVEAAGINGLPDLLSLKPAS